MNRLQKKCLLASAVFHSFLLLLITFGTAFFTPREKAPPMSQLKFVPSIMVENAISGGGGNPRIPETDDRQKGETLTPQPPAPKAELPKPPQRQPDPVPPKPPAPKPEVTRVEPSKPEVTRKPTKPADIAVVKPNLAKPVDPPLKDLLTPKVRNNEDKAWARAEAEARETARQQARAEAAYQDRLTKEFGKTASALREGFASGTTVKDLGGPGGTAFADYRQFVQAIYQDRWEQLLPQDIVAEDTTSLVSVTISRNGKVISSRILRRSNSSAVDRIVQRTLDRVTFVREFPATSTVEQREFTIEFTFRNKKAAG
jgi:protein TonB